MTTTKYKTLNEVFTEWDMGMGIFHWIDPAGVPWADLGLTYELDLVYHGNYSGNKIISPLLEKQAEPLWRIGHVIFTLFNENWKKQWDTLSLEYNPIQNYDTEEKMTNDTEATTYGRTDTRVNNLSHAKTGNDTTTTNITDTRTDDLTHSKTGNDSTSTNGTETRTDNLTETETPNTTKVTDNDVSGFNSPALVPQSKQTETDTGSTAKTNTGTQTTGRTGTEGKTYNSTESDTGTQATNTNGTEGTTFNTTETDTGTVTDSAGGADTRVRNYTLTRKGNIGVTTSQQMIESERALWVWNFFYDVVFPDLDKVLTLQIY